MRATAYDREAAAMMGIDVDRVIVATFFIGSALAGAAGVMVGLVFYQVYHLMGFIAGLKGFTAAVVGGIGSIPGAMLGGLLIGLAEAFITGYSRRRSRTSVVFSILIASCSCARAASRQGGHPEGMSEVDRHARGPDGSASTSGSRAPRSARARAPAASAPLLAAFERIPPWALLAARRRAPRRSFPSSPARTT